MPSILPSRPTGIIPGYILVKIILSGVDLNG